jgi:branched-chain amino acid transport system substrate-binding protein
VPQLFVATGATKWNDPKEFPWTMGWQPNYQGEGKIYAQYIMKNHPNAKIGVLYQNDDYGKDYLYGLRAALGRNYAAENIAAEVPFEVTAPTVQSQMVRIRQANAPIFVILATPTPTIQAYAFGRGLGYNPEQIYLNSVAATSAFLNIAVARSAPAYVNGSLSVAYLKDPTQSRWSNDPAMRLYRHIMQKSAPSANANDGLYFYGVAKAETFVQAMYKAGRNPTRASYQAALNSLNQANRFALPGVMQRTNARDRFIISQMQLQRFNAESRTWAPIGRLLEGRPR